MQIKVLGLGCKTCGELYENTVLALKEMQRDEAVEHITDIVEIAKSGALEMPVLMLDGKIVSKGKVLPVAEIIKLINNNL